MKKITAFFLALFPLIVIVLLFVSGLIVKDLNHVFVSSIEFTEINWEEKYTKDTEYPENLTHQFSVTVLPFNATNPEVYYQSTDESVATIDDHGLLTVKDFGEAEIIAVSQENHNITATCPIKIWDDKIHRIDIANDAEASYLGYHESVHIDARPVPFDNLLDGIDPNVCFTSFKDDDIELTEDGQLTSLREESTVNGKQIHCYIKPVEGKQKQIDNNKLTVNVGQGITGIAFDDPSNTFTQEDKFDLFSHIITYPDNEAVDKKRIKASDFEYITEADKSLVEVSKDGIVTFKKPGEAEFTVTYRKNTDLKLKKKITSSCLHASDVAFNRYNFVDSITNYEAGGDPTKKECIDWKDISWSVFPSDYDVNNVEIASDNKDVIAIIPSPSSNEVKTQLKVVGCGYATLTATAKLDDTTTKIDNCVVHIVDEFNPDDVLIEDDVYWSGSYIYPLRSNLDVNMLPTENTKITWTVDDQIVAANYINKRALEYEMLVLNHGFDTYNPKEFNVTAHFNDVNGEPCDDTFTFHFVKAPDVTSITVSDGQNVNLVAGKKYQFVDKDNNVLYPLLEYLPTIKDDFSVDYAQDNSCTFIPYWGFNCGEMYLSQSKTAVIADISINIIVEQESIGIIADENYPYYTTSLQSVVLSTLPDPDKKILTPGYIDVYPKTATKPDGSRYMLDFKFNFEDENTGQIFQDANTCRIDFKKAGYVNITASLGSTDSKSYLLKSTYGKIGKFALVDADDPEQKLIQSGDNIYLWPGSSGEEKTSTRHLKVSETFLSDSFESYEGMFNDIECVSGDCSCNVTYGETNPKDVTFTIGISGRGRYGHDTIKINAGGFIYYLNVIIDEPDIKEFNLYYRGQKLKKGEEDVNINTSYTNNLDLTVEALPIITKDSCKYSIDDGEEKDVPVNHVIKAYGLDHRLHKITLFGDNNFKQVFMFNIAEISSITDFEIKEYKGVKVGGKNMLYFGCSKTQCALTIQIGDAIFDESIMNNFTCNFNKLKDEHVSKNVWSHSFVVSHIPIADSSEQSYENKIDVVLNKEPSITKTYILKRDVVSRVVFPNHDNLKQSDQKGLQKVHVFGDKSMYSKEEGVIEGYRLPIEIYDYRNRKIDREHYGEHFTEIKKKMFDEELNKRMLSWHHVYSPDCCEYDDIHDCVTIKFYEDDLYTPEEMYENGFEQGYKDVTLSIETKSKLNGAKYTFVPVDGVNVYCQEAIAKDRSLVLQSNVGLEDATQDNIALDSQAIDTLYVDDIYGNGYTLNCHKLHEKRVNETFQLQTYSVFNTTLQGCNDGELARYKTTNTRCRNIEDGGKFHMVAYNVYKNWPAGTECYWKEKQVKFKNCLFYNNLFTSINVNSSADAGLEVYIENCVMFNCSSCAVTGKDDANIYFKGFFDVYNFRNRDALENVVGMNLTFLWDALLPVFRGIGSVQMGADGREYINPYLGSAGPVPYFWDEETGTYKPGEQGLPSGNPHMNKLASLEPFGYDNVALWGSMNRSVDKTAPSYYDEFDEHGNLRWNFMNNQLDKLVRPTPSRLFMLLAC